MLLIIYRLSLFLFKFFTVRFLMSNSYFFKMFLEFLKRKIFFGRLSRAIDIAVVYSEIISLNFVSIYDLSDIEESLLSRVVSSSSLNKNYNVKKNVPLFIVTVPYSTGGHTRLMENLSLMMPSDSDLLITRYSGCEIKSRLDGFFSSVNECIKLDGETNLSYIDRLVDEILCYDLVVLNIHPNDVFTVLACGVAKKINSNIKICFVNHADHVASYGATIADIWYQISLYGAEIDSKRNVKGIKTFIGIPINKPDDHFFNNVKYSAVKYAPVFFTAGASGKYKPFNNNSISPLLVRVINSYSDAIVSVVGADLLKNPWWWFLFLRYNSKFNFYRSLPYDEYLNLTQKADFYIDSHPMPGGTAFVEQFLQGVPCIGIKSGFYGYTPLELIKSENLDDVMDILNNPPSSYEILELQKRIFDVHAFSKVKYRFKTSIYDGVKWDNPMIKYEDKIVTNIKVRGGPSFFRFLKRLGKLVFIFFNRSL